MIIVSVVAVAAVFALTCIIGDGAQMKYTLDYAKYTPRYDSTSWKRHWASYLVLVPIAFSLLMVLITTIYDTHRATI